MRAGKWWRPALFVSLSIAGIAQAGAPAQATDYWPVALGGSVSAPIMHDIAGGPIRGPAGWAAWCAEQPDRCSRDGTRLVVLDPLTIAAMEAVFYEVQARITPREEAPGEDDWRVIEGHGAGDCEDYALTWRDELIRAGLPAGALDIAVAETEKGEIHAVLAIHTDRGTVVFDNRHKTPLPWTSLPYAWLAIEPMTAGASPWQTLPDHHRIGNAAPVTAEGKAGTTEGNAGH